MPGGILKTMKVRFTQVGLTAFAAGQCLDANELETAFIAERSNLARQKRVLNLLLPIAKRRRTRSKAPCRFAEAQEAGGRLRNKQK